MRPTRLKHVRDIKKNVRQFLTQEVDGFSRRRQHDILMTDFAHRNSDDLQKEPEHWKFQKQRWKEGPDSFSSNTSSSIEILL